MKYDNPYKVLAAVTQFLAEHGVEFEVDKKSRYGFFIYDVFLPKGLGNGRLIKLDGGEVKFNLSKPSAIEIKGRLLFDTISRLNCSYSKLLDKSEISSLLLIYAEGQVSPIMADLYKEKFGADSYILTLQEFFGIQLTDDGRTKNFSMAYDWSEESRNNMIRAKSDIFGNRLTLFLGAGVSMSANLPSWHDLLKAMARRGNKSFDEESVFDGLDMVCGRSSIVLGRFVRKMLEVKSEDEAYSNCLHDILYKDFKTCDSSLINEICKFVRNKRRQIESVITYNLDNLMEIALKKNNIENYPVFGLNSPQPLLPVYHVHGFIPWNGNDLIKSVPVLSEDMYHDIYANSYNWSNVEQVHALSRNTCIFIGLSMNDPNLRRLLDIAVRGSEIVPRHYVFLRRINNFKEDKRNSDTMEIQAELLGELGLRVIWYGDYSELPNLIANLYCDKPLEWHKDSPKV